MGNLLHKGWRPVNCLNSNHDNVDVGALIKVELYNTLSKPGKKNIKQLVDLINKNPKMQELIDLFKKQIDKKFCDIKNDSNIKIDKNFVCSFVKQVMEENNSNPEFTCRSAWNDYVLKNQRVLVRYLFDMVCIENEIK